MNLPSLSINNDLMPAVPRSVNADAFNWGRNSRALFIMEVLDNELLNSSRIRCKNCLSKRILRRPAVLDDSNIFGKIYLRFLLQSYA